MLPRDCFILMGMGGLFVLLGLAAILWDRKEGKSYYDSLASRTDVREYLEHQPQRPQIGALRIGGWIAIAIGLVLLIMGGAFLLCG